LESVLLIGGLVVALTVIALWQGGAARAFEGWERGAQIAWSVLPNLVLGFAAAGLIVVVVPPSLIGAAIGDESGMRGLLIATVAGILTPGGPFLQFPLVAALAKGGAAPGPLAAYLTAWSLIGLNRAIVWELPLLGSGFTIARWAISLALPILIGMAMPVVMRLLPR
jgi:uncharacterized membrane protein YraQ (UPF0718 family)